MTVAGRGPKAAYKPSFLIANPELQEPLYPLGPKSLKKRRSLPKNSAWGPEKNQKQNPQTSQNTFLKSRQKALWKLFFKVLGGFRARRARETSAARRAAPNFLVLF